MKITQFYPFSLTSISHFCIYPLFFFLSPLLPPTISGYFPSSSFFLVHMFFFSHCPFLPHIFFRFFFSSASFSYFFSFSKPLSTHNFFTLILFSSSLIVSHSIFSAIFPCFTLFYLHYLFTYRTLFFSFLSFVFFSDVIFLNLTLCSLFFLRLFLSFLSHVFFNALS